MQKIKFLFFIAAINYFSSHTTAQDLQFGFCIDKQGVDYLNEDLFIGDWYEYSRTSHFIENGGRCTAYRFHKPVKGEWPFSRLMVTNVIDFKTNMTSTMKIEGAGKGENKESYKITIVDVDYKEYAVVYGCRQFLLFPKQEIIWILTRSRSPPAETVLKTYDAIRNFGLSLDGLMTIDQENCPDISEFK